MKLPKVITVALYAVAIGLLANVFKSVVMGNPAFAQLSNYDTISFTPITVMHDFENPLALKGQGYAPIYENPLALKGQGYAPIYVDIK